MAKKRIKVGPLGPLVTVVAKAFPTSNMRTVISSLFIFALYAAANSMDNSSEELLFKGIFWYWVSPLWRLNFQKSAMYAKSASSYSSHHITWLIKLNIARI